MAPRPDEKCKGTGKDSDGSRGETRHSVMRTLRTMAISGVLLGHLRVFSRAKLSQVGALERSPWLWRRD